MKIFIDFDDVIFNTKQFKKDFRELFVANGVPIEIFDECYVDKADNRALQTFDPELQLKRIAAKVEVDVERVGKLVQQFIADISHYLFADVREFAQAISADNLAIISFGERKFQTTKILNCGICQLIPRLCITQETKSKALGQMLKELNIEKQERIFFIDDRVEQIEDVKKQFPTVITVLMKRPEGRYNDQPKTGSANYEVCNLREAQELILTVCQK